MFKRTILVLLSLMLVLCMGCGNKDKTDYSKMTPKERVVHLHNKFYMPLAKTYYDFVVDYNMAYNSNTTVNGFYKDMIPLYEKKYLPYIVDLRKKLPDIESKEMQEIYSYTSVLEIYLFDETIRVLSEKMEEAKMSTDTKTLIKESKEPLPKEGEEFFVEGNLAYQHHYSKFVNGKGTYELTKDNFDKLKNGMTVHEVTKLLKMPPSIRYVFQKDNENDQAYYWVLDDNDPFSNYVYFENNLKPTDKYIKLIFREDNETIEEHLIKAENHGVE